MPIPVVCPNCQARLNAPDAAAGKKVKCPKCQTKIPVPAGAAVPAPAPAPAAAPPAPAYAPPPPPPPSGSSFDFGAAVASAKPAKSAPVPPPAARKPTPPPEPPEVLDLDDAPPAPPPAQKPGTGTARPVPGPKPAAGPKPAGGSAFNFGAAVASAKTGGKPPPSRPASATPPEPAGGAFEFDDDPPPAPAKARGRAARDEDDDPPTGRRGRQPAKKGGPPLALILGGAAVLALVVLAGVGYAAYYLLFSDREKDTSVETKPDKGGGTPAPKAAVPAGWKEFSPPGAGFKAVFPDVPQPKGDDNAWAAVSTKEKVVCVIVKVPYGPDLPAEQRSQVADKIADSLTTDLKPGVPAPKQIGRKKVTLAGRPADEVVLELQEELRFGTDPKGGILKGGKTKTPPPPKAGGKPQAVSRILPTDEAVYLVQITNMESGRPKPELENGFFDNFELVK